MVVGGSQAGLAVGYHLMQRRLPFVILDENGRIALFLSDQGRPLTISRRMPASSSSLCEPA